MRVLLLIPALTLVLLTASCGGSRSTSTSQSESRTPAPPTTAANRRLAQADAVRLLRLFKPPPGAQPLKSEPRPLRLLARAEGHTPDEGRTPVDRYRFWRTQSSFKATLAFVKAHLLGRIEQLGWGQVNDPRTPENRTLTFGLTHVSGPLHVHDRQLLVTLVRIPGGAGTVIRVDALASWVIVRPTGEQLPKGVHAITLQGAFTGLPLTVKAPAKVRRIIRWFDSLPAAQWSLTCIPALRPRIRFEFRSAGGALIAQATTITAGSGFCHPIRFSIHGTRQEPLGGNVIAAVKRLLHLRLTPQSAAS